MYQYFFFKFCIVKSLTVKKNMRKRKQENRVGVNQDLMKINADYFIIFQKRMKRVKMYKARSKPRP